MNARPSVLVPGLLLGLALFVVLVLLMMGRSHEPEAPAAPAAAPAPAPLAASLPEPTEAAPAELVKDTPQTAPPTSAPAATPSATEPETQVFHVVVVDLQSQPVEAAQVEVWRNTGQTHPENPIASQIVWDVRDRVLTDATGRCVIRLARDADVLLASKEGVGSSGLRGLRELGPGRNLDGEAVVTLVPQIQLTGRVLDALGAPVAGATIVIRSSGVRDDRAGSARVVPPISSGPDGRFAEPLDFMRQFGLHALAADGRLGGRVVNVKPYETAVDVTIALPGDWAITGTVRDEAGQPVAGASLADVELTGDEAEDEASLMNPGLRSRQVVKAGDDGRYSIPVSKAGRYLVTAFDKDHPPAPPQYARIAGATAQPVLDFTLRNGRSLSVHVVDPSGQPLPDVNVQLRAAPPALLAVTAFLGPTFQRTRVVKSGADGSSLFERLPPDAALEARGCPFAAHQNLPCDSPWIAVPAGATELRLVVQPADLNAASGSIHATVLSAATGLPLDEFQWQVLPEGEMRVAIVMPQDAHGAAGKLVVNNLAAGKAYTLLLMADGLAILDLHGLVATPEGTPVTGTIPLPATLEVEVVDESGKALSFATVSIRRSFEFQRMLAPPPTFVTDMRGLARAEALAPGHYLLSVDAAGGHGETELDLGNGEFARPRVVVRKG